ncbi:hypothetical protein PMAYCL1PPCAC_20931, partial [Pristionchus mayeri]
MGHRASMHTHESDITVVDEGITPICESPRLYIILPESEEPGVVRVTTKRITCIVCRKDTCSHVKEMKGDEMDKSECEEDEEVVQMPIEWVDKEYGYCSHQEPLEHKDRESTWVDAKGVQSRRVITFLSNSCCRYFKTGTIGYALSEAMILDINLLRYYESSLAKNATTLSG